MSKVKHRPVRALADKESLHAFLIKDRVAAAYHLGDLDDRYFGLCRWWGADDADGRLEAVVLLYSGLRLPTMLTLGKPEAIDRILDDAEVRQALPQRFFAHLLKPHLGSLVAAGFAVSDMKPMMRMGLAREDYEPPAGVPNGVAPITHADTSDLMALYHFYPDNFFEPYLLETGFYFGLRKAEGLVAVAGIHVISRGFDIAALGNIVTHPDHRSKGYSTRVTAKLLSKLFESVSLVALNVEKRNVAARSVYERLGFTEHMTYLEGMVTR